MQNVSQGVKVNQFRVENAHVKMGTTLFNSGFELKKQTNKQNKTKTKTKK